MERLRRLVAVVRRAILLRRSLQLAAVWATLVSLVALGVAAARPELPRWLGLVLLPLGPLIGWFLARRRMPVEAELVHFIDRRLEASEAVLSAWEAGADPSAFDRLALASAEQRLAQSKSAEVRPRVLSRVLLLTPVAAMVFVGVFLIPPPAPATAAVGTEEIRFAEAPGLRRIERLPEHARDEEERRELEQVAAMARELRQRLAEGVPQREALDSIDQLRRRVEQVRRHQRPNERRARDRAIEELADEPEMAQALAERDLESLDRAVTRAAARLEAESRQRAREALRRAAEAARAEGDEGLAQSLLRRERLLNRRSQQADLARQLAEAMPELQQHRLRRQLERLSRDGDGAELNQEMVDALREAWEQLTPEERERLAEAMAQAGAAENQIAEDREEAESGPMSAEEYEQMLRQALENLDRLQAGAGGRASIPMPGQGQASGSGSGQGMSAGQGPGQGQGASGGPGGDGDTGTGPPGGQTQMVGADMGPLARVRPVIGEGAPSRTWTEWVDPADGEGSQRQQGEGGATGSAESGEAGGVHRDPIPEDYRDHVRRFFGEGE